MPDETLPPEENPPLPEPTFESQAPPPAGSAVEDSVAASSSDDAPRSLQVPTTPELILSALLRIESLLNSRLPVNAALIHTDPLLAEKYEAEYDAAGYEETKPKRQAARKVRKKAATKKRRK